LFHRDTFITVLHFIRKIVTDEGQPNNNLSRKTNRTFCAQRVFRQWHGGASDGNDAERLGGVDIHVERQSVPEAVAQAQVHEEVYAAVAAVTFLRCRFRFFRVANTPFPAHSSNVSCGIHASNNRIWL